MMVRWTETCNTG